MGVTLISVQAFGRRCQLGEGNIDATNVFMRVSDGFRDLGDQIGDPIRFGQIGTFMPFEIDIDIGMAAGKKHGDTPIGALRCQLIPGNFRHVHVNNRKIKFRRFNGVQGEAPGAFAPHYGSELNFKDLGQKIADAGVVLSHQYRGHGFHQVSPPMVYRSRRPHLIVPGMERSSRLSYTFRVRGQQGCAHDASDLSLGDSLVPVVVAIFVAR